MVLECYKGVFVGCSVHSVVDVEFCSNVFAFFVDGSCNFRLCFLVGFVDVFLEEIDVC